jgi:hypothetical protein
MTGRPFDLELPTKATAGQVIGCAATLWRVLAWDLGERYDAHMRPDHGADWLEKLRQARLEAPSPRDLYKHPLKLHDVSFVLWEPAQNGNSPLRACLPAGVGVYDLMDDIRRQRNADVHDAPEPTLALLDEYARTVEKLATLVGLPVAEECTQLRQRIKDLESGSIAEIVDVDELRAQKTASESEAAMQSARAADLLLRLKDASTERREVLDQLAAAQAAKALADERAALLQAELEKQFAHERRSARAVDLTDLQPGQPWPAPPEGRALRLLTHVVDLFDPAKTDLLSNELGAAAVGAAERWRTFLPHGGTVVLTESGQGVALVGAQWTYLGSLDDGSATA